ncbi:UTP--glucose-1-phosphate uridylyltransferase [Litchfieldia salsa]|uniref:UTP--glucose-1-phosphate uridylyltransferase n=1 Tax=Litchfieldia salsa TaxID=930152 RepID=A0A1H0QCX5_9BACI|nr:UTP--glucose-1-phosphate uridylyltransferase [Litchfieldia salsa]SDP15050.1 UDP-glucose pyrophosphorylase [Litchfieldia salsa]
MVKKAIIPAAGFGTRGLPITKVIPKEMFPVGLKPAIQLVIEEAVNSGIEEILIIVSRTKSLIIDYLDSSLELESFLEKNNKSHLKQKLTLPKAQILYTRQPFAKGLGDAIHLGKNFVGKDPFAVLLPDDIIINKNGSCLQELIDLHHRTSSSVIGLKKVDEHSTKNYGVISGIEMKNNEYELEDIVEKPLTNPPSNLAVIGRYIFNPDIMHHLEDVTPGHGNEIQLTDAIKELLNSQKVYGKVISGTRYDIGIEKEYMKLLTRHYRELES